MKTRQQKAESRAAHYAEHREQIAAYNAENRDRIAARHAAYNAEHRAEIAAKTAAYRDAHRVEIAAYNAAYRAENREQIAAKTAAYRAKHRDRLAAQKAGYWAEHPERRLTGNTKYRGVTIVEDVDPRILFERAMGFCHICMTPVDPDKWDVDHIIPLSAGGVHSYANTAVSHPACNRAKGSRTPTPRKAIAA